MRLYSFQTSLFIIFICILDMAYISINYVWSDLFFFPQSFSYTAAKRVVAKLCDHLILLWIVLTEIENPKKTFKCIIEKIAYPRSSLFCVCVQFRLRKHGVIPICWVFFGLRHTNRFEYIQLKRYLLFTECECKQFRFWFGIVFPFFSFAFHWLTF